MAGAEAGLPRQVDGDLQARAIRRVAWSTGSEINGACRGIIVFVSPAKVTARSGSALPSGPMIATSNSADFERLGAVLHWRVAGAGDGRRRSGARSERPSGPCSGRARVLRPVGGKANGEVGSRPRLRSSARVATGGWRGEHKGGQRRSERVHGRVPLVGKMHGLLPDGLNLPAGLPPPWPNGGALGERHPPGGRPVVEHPLRTTEEGPVEAHAFRRPVRADAIVAIRQRNELFRVVAPQGAIARVDAGAVIAAGAESELGRLRRLESAARLAAQLQRRPPTARTALLPLRRTRAPSPGISGAFTGKKVLRPASGFRLRDGAVRAHPRSRSP